MSLKEFLNAPIEGDGQNELPRTKEKENGKTEVFEVKEGDSDGQQTMVEGEEREEDSLADERKREDETSGQESKEDETEKTKDDDSANNGGPISTDNADLPTDDQNIDPATGECKVVTMDTEEQTNNTEQGHTFIDYASAGPSHDRWESSGQPADVTTTEQPGVGLREVKEGERVTREDGKMTEQLEAIALDETETSVKEDEEGGGEKKGRDSDGSHDATSGGILERLKVQIDSIEGSLKRFFTPELLTGSNKFACSVCTKEKAEKVASLEREEVNSEADETRKGESENVVSIEESEEGDGEPKEREMEGNDREGDMPKEERENDLQKSATSEHTCTAQIDKTLDEADEKDKDSEGSSSNGEGRDHHSNSNSQLSAIEGQESNSSTIQPPPNDHEEGTIINQPPKEESSNEISVSNDEPLPNGEEELPLLGNDSEGM